MERTTVEGHQQTVDPDEAPAVEDIVDAVEKVDNEVAETLAESYMNDKAGVMEVTDVRLDREASDIIVEMETLYGDGGCLRRFDRPERPSLQESRKLVEFLEGVGVSPMEVGDLIGQRVPASYSEGQGWRVDSDRLGVDGGDSSRTEPHTSGHEGGFRPTVEFPTRETASRWLSENRDALILASILLTKVMLIVGVVLAA